MSGGTPAVHSAAERTRIAFTRSCRDTDPLPKVPDAGAVMHRDGVAVQVMHEGTLVLADRYCGPWVTELIRDLRGHHEPQEELIFHHLVRHARPGSLIVELGCWWAYYTNWYLGAVPGAEAVCVEADPGNLEVGRANLALNGRQAEFHNAALGGEYLPRVSFPTGPGNIPAEIEMLDMPALAARLRGRPVEMLHMDMQGAELPFLRSLRRADVAVRFVMVSTHHKSITGSSATHDDCCAELRSQGAVILAEHGVLESYSGDGLVAASFDPRDAAIELPEMSRHRGANPLWPSWLRRKIARAATFCRRLVAS